MKRLQDELGVPVFRKRGRGVVLTEAGEVALAYARRILSLNDELLDTPPGSQAGGFFLFRMSSGFRRHLAASAVSLYVPLSAHAD